jgi:transcriptional regulator with XRE-family HTH domain
VISGDLLREARLRAGLTQRELATRARTSQSAIARWESGEVVPSFERLRELIRACGLELTFGLASYDDSYDSFIERQLRLTPAERVRHMAETAATMLELGEQMRASAA